MAIYRVGWAWRLVYKTRYLLIPHNLSLAEHEIYFVLSMPKHKTTSTTSKTGSVNKKLKMTSKQLETSTAGATASSATAADGGDAEEKYTFFYTKKSPFSQFHPANFTVDGIDYVLAEQYMMHQKAVLFGDDEIAELILQETNPMAIKSLGRKVKDFNEQVWKENRLKIVKKGSYAKFSQNPDLKKQLLSTEGSVLVEASPRDTIWGIGLGADNPKAKTKKTWRGSNLLGYTLTEVRDQLLQEGSTKEDTD